MADEKPIFRTQDTPDSTRSKLNKLATAVDTLEAAVETLEGGVPSDLAATLEDFEQRISALEQA